MEEHFVVRDSEYVKYYSVLHQDQYYHVIHHIGVGGGLLECVVMSSAGVVTP